MLFSFFYRKSTSSGFTLVELLIVIAIIAILLTFITPVLNVVRQHATASVCLGNQMGLIRAYLMYAEDNEDRLACGNTFPPSYDWRGNPGHEYAWAKWPTDINGNAVCNAGQDVTDEDRFRGIRAGVLFAYTGKLDLYHCPNDDRWAKGTNLGNSLAYRIYRSYSIQSGLYGEEEYSSNSSFAIKKLSSIKFPDTKYVFVEAYYDGWYANYNCGSWMLDQMNNGESWWNIMAIWHNEKYTLSFADGHAEVLKCMDDRTIEFAENRVHYHQPDNPDLEFMIKGYAVPLPRKE